eukprot:6364306-Prymnesium_polylepis.1
MPTETMPALCAGSLPGLKLVDPAARRLERAQLESYLARLGLSRDKVVNSAPNLSLLRQLQTAHVDRIAYENISLHCGPGGTPIPTPPLDALESVERICGRQRGGYCFLLVDAFASLLCTLGFS